VICLSDHGQTQGLPFAQRFGQTIEELIGRLCGASAAQSRETREMHEERQRLATRRPAEGWQVGAALHESGGPVARRLRARVQPGLQPAVVSGDRVTRPGGDPRGDLGSDLGGDLADGDPDADPGGAEPAHPVTDASAADRVAPGVVVVLSGHTAMVSFTEHPGRVELETIEREFPNLLPGLVDHDGVGFLLVRSAELGPLVFGRDGSLRLADGTVSGRDPLTGYGPHAADLIRRFDGFANCPDIVINSRYDPATDDASPFEPHVGTHGGLGGPQSRGFLIHPTELPEPGEIVGAEHLHRVLRGWLTHLGHALPQPGSRGAVGEGVPDLLGKDDVGGVVAG
jgi:hypothetical protein